MTAFVVVNPRSGNGRTGRDWAAIERGLSEVYPGMTAVFTERRGEASELVREALQEGHQEIVAVGGDGTINEAVNGMFDADGALNPDAVFAFVTSGTGGDFRKTFGIQPGAEAAIQRLKGAPVRSVDIGRVSCLTENGGTSVRHFINIASFGLSGVIVSSVNRARIAKLFGGSFAFAFHSAAAMLRYRPVPLRIKIDGAMDEIATVGTVAVANGRFFGGGMMIAPAALTDDGAFDVVVLGGGQQNVAKMKLIYTGDHVNEPDVRVVRGHKVTAAPVAETRGRTVYIETDGEVAGVLPATFEIVPRALNVRC
jgi:YegS/Rv2252/BmrU family lipid kinase